MTRYRIWKEPRVLHSIEPWRVAVIPEHGPIRILRAQTHADALRAASYQTHLDNMLARIKAAKAWAVLTTRDGYALNTHLEDRP